MQITTKSTSSLHSPNFKDTPAIGKAYKLTDSILPVFFLIFNSKRRVIL